MRQGILKDNLEKDVNKLDYQNIEINKDLKEILNLKQQMDSKYTNPVNQEELNNNLQAKIDLLRENRNKDIELFKDKIVLFTELTTQTERVFNTVDTSVKIE